MRMLIMILAATTVPSAPSAPTAPTAPTASPASHAPPQSADLVDPALINQVLEQVWHGGSVDYLELKRQPDGLNAYIAMLARVSPGALEAASRSARLAFWINAYNACVLKLVVDHYPIQRAGFPASLVRSLQGVPDNSIRQIRNTWKREFCPVAGKDRALDEIEHEIIRPMGDPRIHFAVNCAARSCPVLAGTAYAENDLDERLDEAVRRFIADPRNYRLERTERGVLHLNKVLDWYAGDFGGKEGVVDFLLQYVPPDDAAYIRSHRPIRVEFQRYDWTLNEYNR